MKKLALFGFGLLIAGGALAASITAIPDDVTMKEATNKLTHNEWNLVAQAVDSLADVFNGVISGSGIITFPGNVKATQLCIGATCKSSWPVSSQWTTSGANINRATGNVGIAVASPSEKLEVAGKVKASAFLYSSDEKLKKNITPITGALAKVEALEGVSFEWKDNGEKNLGFIAQDVETVLPELVSGEELKSVAYGNMTAVLLEAIKELKAEKDAEIAELKAQIAELQK